MLSVGVSHFRFSFCVSVGSRNCSVSLPNHNLQSADADVSAGIARLTICLIFPIDYAMSQLSRW